MEEIKFKVGDKVKIVKRNRGNDTGSMPFCGQEGMTGYIYKINSRGVAGVHELPNETGDYYGFFEKNELVLVGDKAAKDVRISPVKFALQYEHDESPTEYFATLVQAKARIKELASRHDLKRDSIFLHTLAKTQKVELGTSITLRKS